jgi:hypothetical protein
VSGVDRPLDHKIADVGNGSRALVRSATGNGCNSSETGSPSAPINDDSWAELGPNGNVSARSSADRAAIAGAVTLSVVACTQPQLRDGWRGISERK